jgi:putative transposase
VSSTSAAADEPPSYRGYRYPAEIISHAVWLYFRFHLSLRDVEELLAERGIIVTYETIRAWCGKFGPNYAAGLRRRRAQPSDKWHLDAQDQRQASLAMACSRQARRGPRYPGPAATRSAGCRDLSAARACLDGPRVMITDKLLSYPPALRRVLPNVDHRRHKGLNNRAENSHQPTRQRERLMRRFKSAEHAQRFLGPFGAIGDHFRVGRYTTAAATRRQMLVERHSTWKEVVGVQMAV